MYAYGLIKVMPSQQSYLPQDRTVAIPAGVQQEIDMHMQQTLPSNLKYYQKSGSYVPPHVQQEMAQHLEQTMPAHLKQYIGPYMQQRVVSQHLGSAPASQPPNFAPHGGATFSPNQQFSHPFAPPQAPQPQVIAPTQSLQPAAEPQAVSPQQEPYAFITDPQGPLKAPQQLMGGKPLLFRVAVIGGGLVVLLIVLSALKGLIFGGGFNLPPFVAVLQDQQELIHLTTNALQPQAGQSASPLPSDYLNFATTVQVTVTSAQAQLTTYLTNNKQKVSPTLLSLKVSTSIDNQLSTAAAAGTYTSAFQSVMTSQLDTYAADLRTAYDKTSGLKGHAQLSSDYAQASLLVKQLNQSSSSGD